MEAPWCAIFEQAGRAGVDLGTRVVVVSLFGPICERDGAAIYVRLPIVSLNTWQRLSHPTFCGMRIALMMNDEEQK